MLEALVGHHRFIASRAALLGLMALVVPAVRAKDTSTPAEEPDRLSVHVYVGEVINKFSASDRKNVFDPSGTADSGDIERFAGLEVDFRVFDWGAAGVDTDDDEATNEKKWSAHWVVSADHSARVIESPCTDNDPDCSSEDSGGSQDFLKIVKDSNILEWRTGLRLQYRPKYIAFYAKALPGFVRSVDSGDDVVDDHFFGVGVQYDHPKSWFRGSFFEVGGGQTDFFTTAPTGRTKVNAALSIARPREENNDRAPLLSYFLEGHLDSDLQDGPDDIRIYLGVEFDARSFVEALQK